MAHRLPHKHCAINCWLKKQKQKQKQKKHLSCSVVSIYPAIILCMFCHVKFPLSYCTSVVCQTVLSIPGYKLLIYKFKKKKLCCAIVSDERENASLLEIYLCCSEDKGDEKRQHRPCLIMIIANVSVWPPLKNSTPNWGRSIWEWWWPEVSHRGLEKCLLPLDAHICLHYFNQVFIYLVNFNQKESERNWKNQKKNILGERFFLAMMHDWTLSRNDTVITHFHLAHFLWCHRVSPTLTGTDISDGLSISVYKSGQVESFAQIGHDCWLQKAMTATATSHDWSKLQLIITGLVIW